MHKIGDDTITADPSEEFTEGDPVTNTPATEVKGKWLNTLQRELIGVLDEASRATDVSDDNQIIKALQSLFFPAMGTFPSENSPPDMTVKTKPVYTAYRSTIGFNIASSFPFVAPISDPRIDVLVMNIKTAARSSVQGVEAAFPVRPDIPEGHYPICEVYLVPGQTEILNADITDIRPTFFATTLPPLDPLFKRVTAEYRHIDNSSDFTGMNLLGQATNQWISVGPTGSGATVIWTDLDNIPATANYIIVKVTHRLQVATNPTYSFSEIFTRRFGSLQDETDATTLSNIAGQANIAESLRAAHEAVIAIDSTRRFEFFFRHSNPEPGSVIFLELIGFKGDY